MMGSQRGEIVGKRSDSALDLSGKTGYNVRSWTISALVPDTKKGQESVHQSIHIRETEYSRRRAGVPAPVVFP
jgi:hypothetical protein